VSILTASSKTVVIPHSEIAHIVFTWADMVYLKSGEVISCKIVNRIPPDLVLATETGTRRVPLPDIQMYYYHSTRRLQVPSMPATGIDFKNERSFKQSDIRRKFYLGVIAGAHLPPIGEWKESFMAATWIFSGGGRFGIFLKPSFVANLGVEYSYYKFNHHDDYTTEYGTTFIFGGVELVKQINRTPIIYFFVGADVGFFRAEGNLHLFSYRKIDFSDDGFAFLPRVGTRLHVGGRLTVGIEGAYLFVKPVPVPLEGLDDLSIPFSGPSTFFNILYHF
jgi:hypothetical protein